MKKIFNTLTLAAVVFSACSKRDLDVVEPNNVNDLPQLILLADEEAGEMEDEDKIEIDFELGDVIDPSGEELGGTQIPLSEDVTVEFELYDFEGFDNLSDYVLDYTAYYEVDDCTEEDIDITFDMATGLGSFVFPAGVTELTVEFETDPDFFDDDEVNEDDRGLKCKITNVIAGSQKVAINDEMEFEYKVLDDELIFGSWALDHENETQFANFIALYSLIELDLADLTSDMIDEIEFEFQIDKMEVKVVLVETEMIEECGESEEENLEIELEMDYDDLTDDDVEGDATYEGDLEINDVEVEFSYEGSFSIENGVMTFIQKGELDGEETEEITLTLEK